MHRYREQAHSYKDLRHPEATRKHPDAGFTQNPSFPTAPWSRRRRTSN